MANFRIYYPLIDLSIGGYGTGSGIPVHGLQSADMTTTFNLEQVFELGQLDIYQNIENLPNIEMRLEKVIDGYPLIYHLATPTATTSTLANRTNIRSDVFLTLFSDTGIAASGTPITQAYCSGMYVNALTYTLPTKGSSTESVTLVGNDKIWKNSAFAFNGHFTDLDSPASGVARRQDVMMGSGNSIWPTNLPGIDTGTGYNMLAAGQYGAHIQDVTITTTLGREDLLELGRFRPYYRYANFPVAVDCTINITAGGVNPGDAINASGDGNNLINETIFIMLDNSTTFDLGNKNKLQSVTYSGANATGGVAIIAYAFQNFNKLDVHAAYDPAGL